MNLFIKKIYLITLFLKIYNKFKLNDYSVYIMCALGEPVLVTFLVPFI